MDWLDWVQWPAMAVTIAASYFVTSTRKGRRSLAFWLFLVSNAMWVAWGWHSHAHALIFLQFCLAAMNIRGAKKNESDTPDTPDTQKAPETA